LFAIGRITDIVIGRWKDYGALKQAAAIDGRGQ
jgi:hypothetical protein